MFRGVPVSIPPWCRMPPTSGISHAPYMLAIANLDDGCTILGPR